MAVDHQVRQMMRELSRALARAIRRSSDVSEAIRKIRHRGHSPHLVLSCERGGMSARRTAERRTAAGRDAGQRDAEAAAGPDVADLVLVGEPASAEPAFRINGRDVALLKSMGIDPTRRGRGSRGRRGRGRRRS